MKSIEDYPRERRNAIREVSIAMGVDYEAANHALLLNAALWDLYPGEERNIDMVLHCIGQGAVACGSR